MCLRTENPILIEMYQANDIYEEIKPEKAGDVADPQPKPAKKATKKKLGE